MIRKVICKIRVTTFTLPLIPSLTNAMDRTKTKLATFFNNDDDEPVLVSRFRNYALMDSD